MYFKVFLRAKRAWCLGQGEEGDIPCCYALLTLAFLDFFFGVYFRIYLSVDVEDVLMSWFNIDALLRY